MLSLSQLLVSVHTESAGFALLDLSSRADVSFAASDRICLHYVLAGVARLEAKGVATALGPGDLVCLVTGAAHALGGERPAVAATEHTALLKSLTPADELPVFRFGGEAEAEGARLLSGSFTLSRRDGAPVNALMSDVVVLRADETRTAALAPPPMALAACHGMGAGAFAGALMQTLFFQAVRSEVHRRLGAEPVDLSSLQHYKIATAVRLIEREFQRPWTVASLAKAVGMSRSAFALDFQAVTGASPMARLAEVRLTEGRRRLERGDAVAATAQAVGYTAVTAFSRAFHRRHGEPPVALRRRA